MVEYTKRQNKNRSYMSLRVWHRAIDLYKLVCRIVYVDNNLWKLLEGLEKKRDQGTWVTRASDSLEDHHPSSKQESERAIRHPIQNPINPKIHQSNNPAIQRLNEGIE